MSSIDDTYRQCGGERGFLGRPIGPESKTPDGRGRSRHYEKASISSKAYGPASGAKSVFLVALHGSGDRSRHRQISPYQDCPRLRQVYRTLIIRSVPKDVPQVQELLTSCEDLFNTHEQETSEQKSGHYLGIGRAQPILDTQTAVYLLIERAES